MKKYSLSHDAYIEYITVTKGNKDLPFELAELKLNRNIKHGQITGTFKKGFTCQYGTLVIVVSKGVIRDVHHAKKWLRINKYEDLVHT